MTDLRDLLHPVPERPGRFATGPRGSLIDRLARRIDYRGDAVCWEWRGCSGRGYGQILVNGKMRVVHRIVYELLMQAVPEGYELDHLCRNTMCCNPWHLEIVDHRKNVLRGRSQAALNAVKTHCKRGHEFTEANTIRRPSRPRARDCLICNRELGKLWREGRR